MNKLASLMAVAGFLSIAATAPANAATAMGDSTFTPSGAPCHEDTTFLQTVSPPAPAGQYAVPSAGVITSWSFRTANSLPTFVKFKVGRRVSGDTFLTVGESERRALLANQLNTFPIRVAVLAGDFIGFYSAGSFLCTAEDASYEIHYLNSVDPTVGSSNTFVSQPGYQFPLSAQLEPDADSDGYGDETQDACLGDPAAHSPPCPDRGAPNTFITNFPAKRTTKKKATFEFDSSEQGSTFECSLDGGVFSPCTSPHTVNAGKGKHTFAVRAIDAAANADQTPAEATWKVKKRKH